MEEGSVIDLLSSRVLSLSSSCRSRNERENKGEMEKIEIEWRKVSWERRIKRDKTIEHREKNREVI